MKRSKLLSGVSSLALRVAGALNYRIDMRILGAYAPGHVLGRRIIDDVPHYIRQFRESGEKA